MTNIFTRYSSIVGPLINEFFEEYFGVDYALPKQDMVAITERNSGAMEIWGLISYRFHFISKSERLNLFNLNLSTSLK